MKVDFDRIYSSRTKIEKLVSKAIQRGDDGVGVYVTSEGVLTLHFYRCNPLLDHNGKEICEYRHGIIKEYPIGNKPVWDKGPGCPYGSDVVPQFSNINDGKITPDIITHELLRAICSKLRGG
ncbi:hypothetical protein [Dongshaea marina]|uniref:hypothetical protein n=1 Tax=Dongshaea marina TaxID=2047966 RepID=UPI00131F2DAF|nr:hypothetical protein [Dongshaea marina]